MNKQPKKRQRLETRSWDYFEEAQVLNYMREKKEQGCEVEKPTADMYYTKLLERTRLKANVSQVKNKVKNLKGSYSSALQWMNQTGQGVDSGSVEGYKIKLCPHFNVLDAIYGDRATFNVPYMRDTLETKANEPGHVWSSNDEAVKIIVITNDDDANLNEPCTDYEKTHNIIDYAVDIDNQNNIIIADADASLNACTDHGDTENSVDCAAEINNQNYVNQNMVDQANGGMSCHVSAAIGISGHNTDNATGICIQNYSRNVHHINSQIPVGNNNQNTFSNSNRTVVGNNSQIVGNSSQIVGNSSQIVGNSSQIVGNSSQIVGNSSQIVGNSSHIVGNSSRIVVGNSSGAIVGNSNRTFVGNSNRTFVGNSSRIVGNSSGVIVGNSSGDIVGNSSGAIVGNNNNRNVVGNSNRNVVGNSNRNVLGTSTQNAALNATNRNNVIRNREEEYQIYNSDRDQDSEDDSSQRGKISRFKKGLKLVPKSSKGFTSKDKPPGSNAASVMSVALSKKCDALAEKNKIEQKKIDEEKLLKEQQLKINLEIIKEKNRIKEKRVEEESIAKKAERELEIQKFQHQIELEKNAMEIQKADIELKKAKIDSKEKVAILELQKQERLEMFKMKMEYEKFKNGRP